MITFICIFALFCFVLSFYKINHKGNYLINDPFYHGENVVSFYFFSSPHGINWDSPSSLLKSALKNAFSPKNRILGHVAIEVRSKDSSFYEFTSMTDTNKHLYDKLFVQKIGFGLMVSEFPGRLETQEELHKEVQEKYLTGEIQKVSYLISDSNLERLKTYLKEYKENGNDQKYSGLDKDPRYLEGAGCAPFCLAVSEILSLRDDSSQKGWIKEIKIPCEIIGDKDNPVSMIGIFQNNKMNDWANKNEANKLIKFWDLDQIFLSIKNSQYKDFVKKRTIGKANEFLFDRKHIKASQEPLWLKRKNSI